MPEKAAEFYRRKYEELLSECKTPEEVASLQESFSEYMKSVLMEMQLGV